MAYDHDMDSHPMIAALGAHIDALHPVEAANKVIPSRPAPSGGEDNTRVADSSADMGRTGSLGGSGGISPVSNYNGPEAWSGSPSAPKLVDPRPAGNSSRPTFGKRNGLAG